MLESGVVLLVEDNPKILDLNRRMLEQEGCIVLAATTLAEARQRLKISDPDVAVLDVTLPDGSGLDFITELRAVSSAPVLFLTAKSDREDIMAGLAAGGNDYITKPYDIDEFRMRVKGFLALVGEGQKKATRNGTYLPDRLSEKLGRIHAFPLTTVIAPAGYGKTTAVRAFAGDLPPGNKIYRLNVLGGSATDFWQDFAGMFAATSRSFSDALLQLGIPSNVTAQREFSRLADALLANDGSESYVIIDDFHLLPDQGVRDFFLFAVLHLPEHIHVVILSRTPIFAQDEIFSLSAQINEITERDLWYGPKETKEYFALRGSPISDGDAARLSEATEGWIAALYLNQKAYAETGRFAEVRNIHELMDAAIFRPLPDREKLLLKILSLFPVFSGEQAAFVSEMDDAESLLRGLMKNNHFITRQEPHGVYKLHHMFQEVVSVAFRQMPEERARHYTCRAGLAYLGKGEYIQAERMFYAAGDFENLLLSLEQDYGATLTGEHKREFLAWFHDCPREILNAHPIAILIITRRLFLYGMKSECAATLEELKRLLIENGALTDRERSNLLGEVEIGMSFLVFNDVAAMSACHKRACELMDRPTNTSSPYVPWTQGSPSVFATYHRKSGEADRENTVMKEAMPYWYRLNQNHGSGAEHLFEGELHFLRGNFTDAIISLHRALHDANQNKQPVMAFAAEFLRLRIETFQGRFDAVEATLAQMCAVAEKSRLFMLQHTVDVCEAWLFAISGQPGKAADWIAEGSFASSRLMFPAIHFPHMVYCQLLLARGEYAALIAREEEERALYRVFPNLLPEIYLDVQLAAAYEQLGRRRSAINHLIRALEAAAPDQIYMPFVENYNGIVEPLREIPDCVWDSHVERILALYLQNRMEKPITRPVTGDSGVLEMLTERDLSIVELISDGKSNKEIAAELFLAESYVKTLLKKLYQKLGITDEKDKRGVLALMLEVKTQP